MGDQVALADATTIVLFVLSIALSALANYLLRPKDKNVARDDKPTSLAERGSFIPYVSGRRMVGPLFCWAGDRTIVKESVGGGKGGGKKQKTNVYYEGAVHALCVGPAKRLHRIRQHGKEIFSGPIDAASHPSGTIVDLGVEGRFKIYWGEATQPVDADLSAASRIGVASRWPYVAYVFWVQKRLGSSPQWPLLDYDVEVAPTGTRLVESSTYTPPTRTLGATGYAVDTATDGGPRTAEIVVAFGHVANKFEPGGYLRLAGNAAETRDYRIHSATDELQGTFPTQTPVTVIVLDDVLTGSDDNGTVTPYSSNDDDGYNPAHVLDQLLFEPYPHGIGLDRSEWSTDALEELGALAESEGLVASVIAQGGERAKSVVAGIMQDLGFLLPMDPETGLLRPRAVRKPTGTVPALTNKVLLPPRPEVEVLHDERPMDRSIYVFSNRVLNFRDDTVPEDDDAEASRLGRVKTRKVPLPTVTDASTASKVAERRVLEDMAGNVVHRLHASREARLLHPGQAFTAEGVPGTLRCVSTRVDPYTGRVDVEALADYYGADASTYSVPPTDYELVVDEVEEDLAAQLLEVPAYLVSGKVQVVGVPRIRANASVSSARLHLSADGTTYTQVGADLNVQTGGTLAGAVLASGPRVIAQGPVIDALGPDIATVLDLTGDDTNWRLGRQVAVVGGEVMFLRKLTALGGGQYRLDGLIRARYDTVLEAHSAGDPVFIFQDDSLEPIEDSLLSPGATRYLKVQPVAGDSFPLDSIAPVTVVLRGKGITPMDPLNLRVQGNGDHYVTGQDVTLLWGYRSALSPKTGAGMQPAGGATGPSPVDGTFIVRIKTTGGTLKREVSTTSPSYLYTAADRTTDGLEGSNFKFTVVNASGGFSSSEVEKTVVHLT